MGAAVARSLSPPTGERDGVLAIYMLYLNKLSATCTARGRVLMLLLTTLPIPPNPPFPSLRLQHPTESPGKGRSRAL
eukprot:scaffold59438_cov26-Tisochrysis_lutea.AAC.4